MKVYFLLAILVAIIYVCESKKHHKNHEKKDLFRKPSAKPFHHGSKQRTGHLRGQHLFGKHSGFVSYLLCIFALKWFSTWFRLNCLSEVQVCASGPILN